MTIAISGSKAVIGLFAGSVAVIAGIGVALVYAEREDGGTGTASAADEPDTGNPAPTGLDLAPFRISDPDAALRDLAPGTSHPLDLRLSNPTDHELTVSTLSVALEDQRDGCPAGSFSVRQLSDSRAIVLHARAADVPLTSLGVPHDQLPRLLMVDLDVDQDLCKGRQVRLLYSGSAATS